MTHAYLLTGKPGSGKTTIIKDVLLKTSKSAGGFYTEEIRLDGIRQGFRIMTLQGQEGILASISIHGCYRVGKYGVNVSSIDEIACKAVTKAINSCDVVVIDEIGKMELFSASFKEAVISALESNKKVLGTIIFSPHPWADKIKQRSGVTLTLVTRDNHEQIAAQILGWLES